MKKFITTLQSKSEGQKRFLLLASTFGITGAIFLVWAFFFVYNLTAPQAAVAGPSPFGVMADEIRSVGQNFSSQVASVGKK